MVIPDFRPLDRKLITDAPEISIDRIVNGTFIGLDRALDGRIKTTVLRTIWSSFYLLPLGRPSILKCNCLTEAEDQRQV